MTRYRSRPSEVEAIDWTGGNWKEVMDFAGDKVRVGIGKWGQITGECQLLAGKDGAQKWVPVPVGHWIVRSPGDESDYWPVDPDYFAAKYELAQVFSEDGTELDYREMS